MGELLPAFDPDENVGVIHYPQTGQSLRWVRIDGVVWLHFADLCKGTGHGNSRTAIHIIEDEDKRKFDMLEVFAGHPAVQNWTAGPTSGNTEAWFVNEDGFTTLGLAGRGDGPKVFRRWVVKVVLPQFRQTQRALSRKDLALMVVAAEEERELAVQERNHARAALEAVRPKVEIYDQWLTSEAVEMTDFAKRIGFTPPTKFTATLRDLGILRKDRNRLGKYRNLPTKDWEGAFDIVPTRLPTGGWIDQALINTSGQMEILDELRDAGHDL